MKTILVVGDTILDHYVHGEIERVNPEAPHSVVLDYQRESLELGGAANVASIVKSLLGNSAAVHYYGATSPQVSDLLTMAKVATSGVTHDNEQILLKTRYICNNHYLLRLDKGKKYSFAQDFKGNLETKLKEYRYDLIVISDYNKGTLTSSLVDLLCAQDDRKILIDIKSKAIFSISPQKRNNVILKCNEKEFNSEIDQSIIENVAGVIQTIGGNGAVVWRNVNGRESAVATTVPCVKVPVANVIGAGDAFLAGMSAHYIKTEEWDLFSLTNAGNNCASREVQKFR